ncbi:MAG: ABC transporter substrate-binding protein [Promethearchaeota archaeon]
MRNNSRGLIFLLLLSSLILPAIPIVVNAQEEIPIFTVGAVGPRSIMNWDRTTYVVSTGDYYMNNALETLYALPDGSAGDIDELLPVLATSWTIETRPDEWNYLPSGPFKHYAGIKSITLTLRQNVKFQDGSDWNATACKWNIDRIMYILGNINGCITGNTDSNLRNNRATWWLRVSEWAPYSTTHWNISKLTPGVYAEFGSSADYATYFPRINNVTIIENLDSGGKVKVEFNDWLSGIWYLATLGMMSMKTYENYFDVPIFGYGQSPGFPQDNPAVFPGHLIGTGPYIYQGHESDAGTMVRFDNWWNATAQQARGLDTIPHVAINTFAHTEAGYQARSTAMVTGDLDFAYDRSWEPLNYDDMIAAPDVNYVERGLESYGEYVILNCINETYLRYWSDVGANVSGFVPALPAPFLSSGIMNPDGTINAHGTNRAFRKAISYAFDYDTFIHVAFNDRVARAGGFLAKTHEYYNPSIPLAYRNLDIARQALLDDPYWGPRCVARHLSLANTTAEWRNIAVSNPIYRMHYDYDQAHLETLSIMTESLKDIGCGIDTTEDIPDTYTKMTSYFSFPWWTCDGFSLKAYYPRINSIAYYSAYFKSPGVVEHNAYGYPISDWPYGYYAPGVPVIIPYYTFIFPYVQFANWGFNYNATCDGWISQLWFQNSTGQQMIFNKLTDWAQNFQYPIIWMGNDLTGYAIDKDWDYSWFWPVFQFTHAKFLAGGGPGTPISGFSIGIVLSVSLIAFLGIVYTIRRKKNLM